MGLSEREELELLELEEREGSIQPAPAKDVSSYEGVPDKDLNILQRGERAIQKAGLIQPGREMISPESLKQKKMALATAANTAAFGYLPQIAGAVKSGSVSSPEYIKDRDLVSAYLAQAEGGTKAAGTAIGVLPSLGGGLVKQAATPLKRVLQNSAVGGALGLAANPGDEPGKLDPIQLDERLGNAATSALVGGSLSAAGEAPAAVDKLRKSAQWRALKQGGAMLKDYRKFDHKGTLGDAGQTLLDEGIVTPFASTSTVAERAGDLAEREIGKVDRVYDILDGNFEKLSKSKLASSLPNGERIADAIETKVIASLRGKKAMHKFIPELEEFAAQFRADGSKPLSFGSVRKELQGFDELLDWNKEQTPSKELTKKLRGAINSVLEESVDSVGKASNFPLYEDWKRSKQVFGMANDVAKMGKDKTFRETANRFVSPTDYLAAGVGALKKEPITGVIAGTANHLTRKYGNALAATGANSAANLLGRPDVQQASRAFAKAAPVAGVASAQLQGGTSPLHNAPNVVEKLKGTRFYGPLSAALERGNDSFATTYYMLSQTEPELQSLLSEDKK